MKTLLVAVALGLSCNVSIGTAQTLSAVDGIGKNIEVCEKELQELRENGLAKAEDTFLQELQSRFDALMLDILDLKNMFQLLDLVTDAASQCAGRSIVRSQVGVLYLRIYMARDSLRFFRDLPWGASVANLIDDTDATFIEAEGTLKQLQARLADCATPYDWTD